MGESEELYFLPRLDTEVHIISQVDKSEAIVDIKNNRNRFGTRYRRKLTEKEKAMDEQTVAEQIVEETHHLFVELGKKFSRSMDEGMKKLNFNK